MEIFDVLPFAFTDVLMVVKGFYLLGLFMYLIFAAVMIRQVQMMNQSLEGVLKLPLFPIAFLHLLTAVGVFFLAAIFL